MISVYSLLTDPSVMNKKNFAEGYNVSTGKVHNHPANNKYGEVHTGDAWLPTRDRYCQNKSDMPVGLIVFIRNPRMFNRNHSIITINCCKLNSTV